MDNLKLYVKNNSELLFKHLDSSTNLAFFDNKGFSFTDNSQARYNVIKHSPHLYVAWTDSDNGYYYIGKSFQKGGRWKRQHAYHLGTLAHHLLNAIRYDDQNHQHWIDHWMIQNTVEEIGLNQYSIQLKREVKIAFIPFNIYSSLDSPLLKKQEIREINTTTEKALIDAYKRENKILLNVQHN